MPIAVDRIEIELGADKTSIRVFNGEQMVLTQEAPRLNRNDTLIIETGGKEG